MKKVFSLEKYKEDCKKRNLHEWSINLNIRVWASLCDGLTSEEMLELGCHTDPDWMVNKEEFEEEEK